MKELNRKVFKTIFWILSSFIVIVIFVYNVSIYTREYHDISRTLNIINDPFRIDEFGPEGDFDNMMIMNYEVYTIKLNNGVIEKITYHGNELTNFNIEEVAEKVINSNNSYSIGNLYLNRYAYNYTGDNIVIINTTGVGEKLLLVLVESLLVLFIFEIFIYYLSITLTKRITKPAEDAFQKQKEFIADASHELKTPLAVIMASSDELKNDKKNKKYIDNIKYESERMNTLIRSLLDLSKLENGVNISNYKDENISKIIERVTLTFEGIAYEEGININTNIEDNIIFKCSKDEIERLISIILDNAVKHSYKDSSIDIFVSKDKNNIKIEIINSGDPIKEGDEEKIFERFYRGDKSRNRESNRYGLGLAIAKNIVTNHNGTIKASSNNGKTTFTINLKK